MSKSFVVETQKYPKLGFVLRKVERWDSDLHLVTFFEISFKTKIWSGPFFRRVDALQRAVRR